MLCVLLFTFVRCCVSYYYVCPMLCVLILRLDMTHKGHGFSVSGVAYIFCFSHFVVERGQEMVKRGQERPKRHKSRCCLHGSLQYRFRGLLQKRRCLLPVVATCSFHTGHCFRFIPTRHPPIRLLLTPFEASKSPSVGGYFEVWSAADKSITLDAFQ